MHYGLRYTVLLALPNFDPVKFTVVDPMHNLFLGTANHVFKVWIETGTLTAANLVTIRCKVFQCPVNIGRLPANISTGYGGFTANQWSNWITIFSPVVLKGLLPDSHLRCWLLFVGACWMLRKICIKSSEISSADLFLLQFCRLFEEIYGPKYCTPNMHLHVHLKECLLDYGPLHAFWCYAFERFNGILGSIHTNRKAIECQLMRKFCQEQELSMVKLFEDAEFRDLMSGLSCGSSSKPSTNIASALHMIQAPLKEIVCFANDPSTFT